MDVCLFVCRVTQKLLNRFSQKFGGKVAYGPRKKQLDFEVSKCVSK